MPLNQTKPNIYLQYVKIFTYFTIYGSYFNFSLSLKTIAVLSWIRLLVAVAGHTANEFIWDLFSNSRLI